MSEVMKALKREHVDMQRLLDALERQLAEFDRGVRPDYEIVQGVIDYCLTYPDLYHHPKEDLVLERLRARDPVAAEAVGDLTAEHESLADQTRRLAAAVRNVLKEAEVPRETVHLMARSFLDFYRDHIAKEEERFFPAALEALTAKDWRDIEARLSARADPLFSREPEARFVALRQEILAWEREVVEQPRAS